MLTGIRTGKRKRRKADGGGGGGEKAEGLKSAAAKSPAPAAPEAAAATTSANLAAAEELRRQLLGGGAPAQPFPPPRPPSGSVDAAGGEDVLARRERRGRIASAGGDPAEAEEGEEEEDRVVLTGAAGAALEGRGPQLQREDFRHGSRRGKVPGGKKGRAGPPPSERDMTVAQMAAEERAGAAGGIGGRSMDEVYARNVARVGSRYRGTDFARGQGAARGADEEDMHGIEGGADMSMFRDQASRLTGAEAARRERARQVALHDRQGRLTARCWWWLESSSFARHRLLALGDHVSLVLCPSHLALTRGHCLLVPIKHSDSFRSCEDEVWDEVQRFRTSLRNMFRQKGGGMLFCETVTPSSSSGGGLWQARMECVPVSRRAEDDAAIYFKSALAEQAEEWGTHNRTLPTREKGLRGTVPKGFPYFNVEWDGGGFAQIIESGSFPRDFGLDTIAGMMELDPVKFNRKKKAPDDDRGEVAEFCKRWKEFDWTLELD